MFPKSLSNDLLGITIVNGRDKELDEIFANSMIIAARSILLFGKGHGNPHNIKANDDSSLNDYILEINNQIRNRN